MSISDFSVNVITKAINKIPNPWGLVQQMGIFQDDPIATTKVTIEQDNGVLNLISSTNRRSDERNKNERSKRTLYTVDVPHLPLDDELLASDIQDVRAFGDEAAGTTETIELEKILRQLRRKHAITWEYFQTQALTKGQVIDADGSVLADFFDIFDISQESIDFEFTTDTTPVQTLVLDAKGHIEDNIQGDVIGDYMALCSPEWFRAFIEHPKVREAYAFFLDSNGRNFRTSDPRQGFRFGEVTWIEYRGRATWKDPDGNTVTRKFIETDKAFMFPTGTLETFMNNIAPGNLIQAANTRGLPVYAFQKLRNDERGWDIFSESNHLPICLRPQVLVELTKS